MIRKIFFALILVILSLISLKQVNAVNFQTAILLTPDTTRTLTLPPQAIDHSPVISLGTAIDPQTNQIVEGYAFIHYKDQTTKPNGAANPAKTSCFAYLSSGTKWKTAEPWILNPANLDGLTSTSVFTVLNGGINKWEDAADGIIGNNKGVDVLGIGSIASATLVADTIAPDGQNEVYFADIADENTIAVTIVWGIFSGAPQNRKLVEWDQVFDDVTFDWSAETSGMTGKMDFDNIATHELGHSMGMSDLYNSCTEETMYGYAANAEIKKRDLNPGDISGINQLY